MESDAAAETVADGSATAPVPDAQTDIEPLFAALSDTTQAPDAELPATGVPLDIERRLSPPFVLGDTYGTRCSTVVLAACAGLELIERRFGANGVFEGDRRLGA